MNIDAIRLVREKGFAVVYVESDGKQYKAISEVAENNFDHWVSLDHILETV